MALSRSLALLAPAALGLSLLAMGCGAAPPPVAPNEAAAAPPPAAPNLAAPPPPALGDAGGAVKEAEKKPEVPRIQSDDKARHDPMVVGKASAPNDGHLMNGLSQAEILAAVQDGSALFDKCYDLGGKDLAGSVKLKATIGPTGVVNVAEVVTSNVKNAKVDACVLESFKKVKFPPPHGGGTAVITFPMTFTGREQVR